MARPHRALLPFLLLLLVAAAPADAASLKAPAGSAFYKPPSHLPGKRHGDVVWFRKESSRSNMTLARAARNLLVLYRSTSISGKPVAESGAVAIPKGKAPKGGWPVITWAHGTTGLADSCAPTRMKRHTDAYAVDQRAQFSSFLKAGYAVVAADYEGLGTPGPHPYLIGRSEGRSVLDMVRAARELDPRLGKSVAIMGHSQGGHAALWAAALAPTYTPELKVRGTIAYAPASHVAEQSNLLDILTSPTPLSALIASILRGADVADPALHIRSLLTDRAAALWPSVDRKCTDQLSGANSWGGIAPSEILKPGVDRAPTLAEVGANDPETLTIRTPVDVLQGEADTTVFPMFTDQLVNEMRAKGTAVEYHKYPGIGHSPVFAAGKAEARAYLKKRFGR